MEQLRALVQDGRLRDASAQLVLLTVSGPEGDHARSLLRECRQKTDLVQAGLAQVLRAVHGRESASREGLEHCVRRLEELERIQSDDPDLSRLKASLESEIRGLELLARIAEAVARADASAGGRDLIEFSALRDSLAQPTRLDARLLEIVDQILAQVSSGIGAGRLDFSSAWLESLRQLDVGDLAKRVASLFALAESRMSEARIAVDQGREALERRDLDEAEEQLDVARVAWVDGADVKNLESALAEIRSYHARAREIEQMAIDDDVDNARRELERMGPTPGVLRTRIFDLKRSIARAQGLDRGFMLRVDEAGEFVVVRGDSLTIGNLRDRSADLPILANLASQHARIRRSMSFHGGLQDRIVEEHGSVVVDGQAVRDHRLVDGTRVRLGSLEFDYSMPSSRSLTAMLALRGGFQIHGSDRILLMKDRGRDGRILIGAGRDVHVRVADAAQEVEVFATNDGQIRVASDGPGTIDGKPFVGQHPIGAGAIVTCERISFVLQPWSSG
jgi:hypothetical protein